MTSQPPPPVPITSAQSLRLWAARGLVLNLALAVGKLLAGIIGHSYALIADALESLTDILGSAVIWSGLWVSARPPDDRHPYGYGKAEALAALFAALILFAAGLAIAFEAVREIITPHHAPAWWTLVVLVIVVVTKEVMFRLVRRVARHTGSTAVEVDAAHHRADAITSILAFIGISIALVGGPGWEPADDYAALAASAIILYNAGHLIPAPFRELLDADAPEIITPARDLALTLPGVRGVEKLRARRSGTRFFLDIHLEVDPDLPVRDAHAVAGRVRAALRDRFPRVADALIHIEPAPDATRPLPPAA